MDKNPRLDKFIWSVRLCKTRSQAAQKCRLGRVKVNGQASKPSREMVVGDVLELTVGDVNRTIRIIALLGNRVGAKLVPTYIEDLTPSEELERVEMMRQMNKENRPRGTGRPTKRDRRDIEKLKDFE